MELPENLDHFVHVGKITKPHGIRGEVKIIAFSGDAAPFKGYHDMVLVDGRGKMSLATLKKCRVQDRFAVVVLAGITTRNHAEELAGMQVWVDESHLPDLDDTEFYWRDVMGGAVVSSDGQHIGKLINLFDAGGSDMMVVQTDRGEVLVPAQREFIVEVNEAGIVVDLPPGLLDVNVKD